jgi:hypothetical protein
MLLMKAQVFPPQQSANIVGGAALMLKAKEPHQTGHHTLMGKENSGP